VGLRVRLNVLEEELQTLDAFRETKNDMERQIGELRQQIDRMDQVAPGLAPRSGRTR
jgi:hypothetical protein